MSIKHLRAWPLLVLVAVLVAASTAASQAPGRPAAAQPIKSMGQPPKWEPYVVGSGVFVRHDPVGLLAVGLHRPITNPVIGLFGVAGEAYATASHGADPGARLLATTRALGLSAGADWDGRTGDIDAIFSFQTAIRRGGLLGHGTLLRLDWLPGRTRGGTGGTFELGIHVPAGQPFAGRTRPRDTDADLPRARERRQLSTSRFPRAAEPALGAVERAAAQILAYTNLFAEDTARIRYGESYTSASRAYAAALTEAFGIAANNVVAGETLARRARANVLEAVILPYDSLFGQVKNPSGSIRALTSAAQARWLRWLRDSSRASPAAQPAIASVHARWLHIIERVHANLHAQWGGRDSRLVWLPLQLAVTEDQYDEQSEVDALIERVVGRPFTDRNALAYLRSSDIPLEIARSIFAARDYHVQWTHDFTGRRDRTRQLDEVAYTMVADAYLPALTQAVQRYDSTRQMPLYLLLLDQFYYARRDGRLWMDILENPLHANMKLPGRNAEHEAHLRKRQAELREAVARSWLLQQDATANGGDRWLRKVVKVHVSIVSPSDFSFRSRRIIPPWPFVSDNLMRDHRKVTFYDVTEADPYRGALILTGIGIGEHYASATWEDRGYRVRGPAALEIRSALRRALVQNGFKDADIPLALRAAPSSGQHANPGAQPATHSPQPSASPEPQYVGRALQVHNETGFGAKEASVARAMLYNLAPAGSVIIVPDPIWVSDTWAAMLAGAAARGCRVYVIAPSVANNPNPHPPIEAMLHDVMRGLLQVRDRLGPQIRAAGGELRVGLYTARAQVTDVVGRRREMREGLRRYPWIRDVIPFDAATLAVLDRAAVQTESDGTDATSLARDEQPRAPQLHQKTQLIARPGALAALVRQPGWDDVIARAMRVQSRQTARFADQLGWTTPDVDSAATRSADAIIRGYEQGLSEADRRAVSFYFSVGTQNQDPRGLMLDAEATLLVSGLHAAAGVVDFFYIMTRSTWIDTKQELDQLLPRPKGFMARVARMIRFAL